MILGKAKESFATGNLEFKNMDLSIIPKTNHESEFLHINIYVTVDLAMIKP